MGRTRKVKEKVVDLSCGILATSIDIVLFCFFQILNTNKYGAGSVGMRKSQEVSLEEVMALGIDKETVKKAIGNAIHKKLIKKTGDDSLVELTEEGRDRISRLLPIYREKRTWNGHFYLVIYDIEERKKQERNILRNHLKKLGCGLLQNSVWLTPYNPKNILHDFIEEKNLSGAIIVSDIGKDGSIGEESIDELIKRVYRLDELNLRYKELIDFFENKKVNKIQAEFQYLSILQDDPQLPFEILPRDWMGDKVYQFLNSRHKELL